MTKQEKIKATKEAKRIYNHFLFFVKEKELAYICSSITVDKLIVNSKEDKLLYWKNVKERLSFFYL